MGTAAGKPGAARHLKMSIFTEGLQKEIAWKRSPEGQAQFSVFVVSHTCVLAPAIQHIFPPIKKDFSSIQMIFSHVCWPHANQHLFQFSVFVVSHTCVLAPAIQHIFPSIKKDFSVSVLAPASQHIFQFSGFGCFSHMCVGPGYPTHFSINQKGFFRQFK